MVFGKHRTLTHAEHAISAFRLFDNNRYVINDEYRMNNS